MKEILTLIIILKTLSGFGQHKTELVGHPIQINIDTIILAQSYKDLRYAGIEIPIRGGEQFEYTLNHDCLLYTSPSPRDKRQSRMPSSA